MIIGRFVEKRTFKMTWHPLKVHGTTVCSICNLYDKNIRYRACVCSIFYLSTRGDSVLTNEKWVVSLLMWHVFLLQASKLTSHSSIYAFSKKRTLTRIIFLVHLGKSVTPNLERSPFLKYLKVISWTINLEQLNLNCIAQFRSKPIRATILNT